MDETLKNLSLRYEELNNKKKEYDKKRKEISNTIQQLMREKNLSKYEDDDVCVNYIERATKKVKEEKLLDVIKKHDIDAIKEAPDVDKLEQLIDENELTAEQMQEISDCIKINEYSYVTAKTRSD